MRALLFLLEREDNFVNDNKSINKIQIGKRNHDVFDTDLKWGSLVHRYLELTMPSDYNLSSKDQVDVLVNGLDKKELNNLAEIVQNITNRKETVFFFDEKVYKSAINEFSFMLDQKTFVIDRIVEFEHEIYVLDYKIGFLKKINKFIASKRLRRSDSGPLFSKLERFKLETRGDNASKFCIGGYSDQLN